MAFHLFRHQPRNLHGPHFGNNSQLMEEYSNVYLVSSAEQCPPFTDVVQNLPSGSFISSPSTETGPSSGSGIAASGYKSAEDGRRNVETSNRGKCSAHSKELICPHLVSANSSHDESYRYRSSTTASTSFIEQETSDLVSINDSANQNAVNAIDNSEKGVPPIFPGPSSSSSQTLGDSFSDGVSAENHASEITAHNSSVSHVPALPITFQSQADESIRGALPAGLGFLVSNREQSQLDGSVLHVDVVSISSNILSSGSADASNREARRNSRGLFWDSFSRRSSGRLIDSSAVVFSADDAGDLGSHNRWLLDFSGDFFDDVVRGDSGYLGSRILSWNEQRRHSRSETWERLRSGYDENGQQTRICPSGIHPDGSCSCESFVMSDESHSRAISRIVILPEALFEVLDEIHHHPVSLPLSMVSLPAPESVVDSFPLKNHKKADKARGGGEDVEQCYICLAEYEEGDKIRVLPCHHEYHMSCVDKWLKEIHGVCPLCRGDVCQVATESCNTETPNI